mmetsp:Transcript_20257/g.48620  ORF Transcript_20257/g.48620 Transcript_20257/m.48620 type:complete len:1932 (+) Transcript_20257:69-5864(+)
MFIRARRRSDTHDIADPNAGGHLANLAKIRRRYRRKGPPSVIRTNTESPKHRGVSGKVYSGYAFGMMDVATSPRRQFISLVEHRWFDRVVLLLIITNSVVMAMQDPLASKDPAWTTAFEWVFTVLFSIEATCKMIAEGFLFESRNAYLTDVWNWVDLLTVVVSWISLLLPDAGNLSAIRSVRVLKPLRTVKRVPGLRVLIGALLHSLPGLGDVARLFVFFLLAFGVISVELFAGTLHYQCFEIALGADAESAGSCACPYSTRDQLATRNASCDYLCDSGYECRYSDVDPAEGATSFDNIFTAVVNIFQAMTLEGWTDIMYLTQVYHPVVAPIFFIIVCFMGGVFVLNLFLVVMSDSYFNIQSEIKQEKLLQQQRAMQLLGMDTSSGTPGSKDNAVQARAAVPTAPLSSDASKSSMAEPSMYRRTIGRLERALRSAFTHLFPGHESLKPLANHHRFEFLMVVLILLNTVVMGLDYYGKSKTPEYDDILRYLNYVFTFAFLFEMMFKLVALGSTEYCKVFFNIFDALVVLISIVEIVISVTGSSANMNLSSLRALRLLRAFKLARSFPGLRKMIATIGGSITQTRDLAAVLLLIIFIFALLGTELFAGNIGSCLNTTQLPELTTESPLEALVVVPTGAYSTPRDACLAASPVYTWEAPPENFDSLGDALATMYVVFVGENWNDLWHDAYPNNGWISTIFFIVALLVGQFILLNLFLGIILSNFQPDNDAHTGRESSSSERNHLLDSHKQHSGKLNDNGYDEDDPNAQEKTAPRQTSDIRKRKQLQSILHYRILWGVGATRWRRVLLSVIAHPYFETLVIVVIIISSASLALDNPRAQLVNGVWTTDPDLSRALSIIDLVCTVFFTTEALMKIGAVGLYANPSAYLRDNWNKIDVTVVFISWLSLGLNAASVSSGGVRALRALRVLRPIRLVNRIQSMRIVVNSIFLAIPGVANVAALLGFFLLVFAILGVQFFGGSLAQCEIASISTRRACEETYRVLVDGRTLTSTNRTAIWYNPDVGNFDDVLSAMLVLFEMITAEMWPVVLHAQIDAYAVDEAPRERSSLLIGRFYCFLWNFLGTLLIGNLFIGVLIDNFDKLRGDERGRGTLTPAQMGWVAVQKLVMKTQAVRRPARPPDEQHLQQRVYDFVMAPLFENSVTVLIIANTLAFAVPHFKQAPWVTDFTDSLNFAFNTIWLLEAILKIKAFGWNVYVSFAWNRFDLYIVILGIADSFITIMLRSGTIASSSSLESVSAFLRLARLLRLVRVVQNVRSLSTLFRTLISSLPSLASIAALMGLLLFMYAVLGVQLFYNVRHGEFINKDANFETFGRALLLLFRCATGENWNGIMHDLSIQEDGHVLLSGVLGSAPRLPRCSSSGLGNVTESDCGSFIAIPYFISFTLVGFCVLIQALVAVLLGHFSTSDEEFPIPLSCFEDFVFEWSKLDPGASRWILATQFATLIKHTDFPLGVKDPATRDSQHPTIMEGTSVLQVMAALHTGRARLRVHGGQHLMFYEVLMSLATRDFELPADELGPSRFAHAHRATVRRFMKGVLRNRHIGARQMSRKRYFTRTKSNFRGGKAVMEAVKAKDLARTLEDATVLDVYFATLLQAAAQGYRARKAMKDRLQERRKRKGSLGTTDIKLEPEVIVGAPVVAINSKDVESDHSDSARQVTGSPSSLDSLELVQAGRATVRALERITMRSPDASADAQLVTRLVPRTALIVINSTDDELPESCSGDAEAAVKERAADLPAAGAAKQQRKGTPLLGFFVFAHKDAKDRDDVPYRWIPCRWHASQAEAYHGSVQVIHSLAATGGRELTDKDLVANPSFALRVLRDKHASRCGALRSRDSLSLGQTGVQSAPPRSGSRAVMLQSRIQSWPSNLLPQWTWPWSARGSEPPTPKDSPKQDGARGAATVPSDGKMLRAATAQPEDFDSALAA